MSLPIYVWIKCFNLITLFIIYICQNLDLLIYLTQFGKCQPYNLIGKAGWYFQTNQLDENSFCQTKSDFIFQFKYTYQYALLWQPSHFWILVLKQIGQSSHEYPEWMKEHAAIFSISFEAPLFSWDSLRSDHFSQ